MSFNHQCNDLAALLTAPSLNMCQVVTGSNLIKLFSMPCHIVFFVINKFHFSSLPELSTDLVKIIKGFENTKITQ